MPLLQLALHLLQFCTQHDHVLCFPLQTRSANPTSHAPAPALPPVQSAKASGEEYDPRGIGSSWNHSFLSEHVAQLIASRGAGGVGTWLL